MQHRIIEVRSLGALRAYESPAHAISRAKGRQSASENVAIGQALTDVRFRDDTLWLIFETVCLQFVATLHGTRCAALRLPVAGLPNQDTDGPVIVRWHGAHEHVWDRMGIVDTVRGKKLAQITENPTELFLDLASNPPLEIYVSSALNTRTEEALLFWWLGEA